MQGSFDKQPQGDRSAYQSFSIKLVALPVLFIVALIGMAVSRPSASKWISTQCRLSAPSSSARTPCRTWRRRRNSPGRPTRSGPSKRIEHARISGRIRF